MFKILKSITDELIKMTEPRLFAFLERYPLLPPLLARGLKESGLRRLLNLQAIHGLIYGQWAKEYIYVLRHFIQPILNKKGRQYLADHYHGKILTPDHAQAIVTLDKPIPLMDLEQIIPYRTARDLVLDGSPDIAVFNCPCRESASNKDPCEPLQVCMSIGQPFVDFMLAQHKTSRKLTQEEALKLLQEEHERGHVHTAWFKDACIDRFYTICNCCSCCCGGIQAMMKQDIPMLASSGYVAQVDRELCIGCGKCAKSCHFEAVAIEGGKSVVAWEKCMGCGVCVSRCKSDALTLVRDERKGIPLDVRRLTANHASTDIETAEKIIVKS